MIPASPAARALHAKLSALASRGIEGEADAAKDKLTRLESRYDFAAFEPPPACDIFAGVVYFERGNSRPLSVKFDSSDLASFVKWALQSGFGVEGSLGERDGRFVVKVEAALESMPTLNHVAKIIRDSFARLWREFSALPGSTERDARLFLRAMYDGMMNDERKAGEMLPVRSAPAVKRQRGRQALAVAPGVAVHPYEIGVTLGRSIRMSIPIGNIVADLKGAEAAARLEAA